MDIEIRRTTHPNKPVIVTLAEDKLEELANDTRHCFDHIKSFYVGQDCRLLNGKHQGRRARITSVVFSHQHIRFEVRPYRLDGQLGPEYLGSERDLLHDHDSLVLRSVDCVLFEEPENS